jgi:hypothetical protein
MAHKHLLTVRCPCCSKRIEVDTRNGKVRALDKLDGGLDALLESHKTEGRRLADAFDSATDEEKNAGRRLDDLLREAERDVRENPDKGDPLRPFDLD